jgi:hypothetical protein
MNLPGEQIPNYLVDRGGGEFGRHNEFKAVRLDSNFFKELLSKNDPFPRAEVSLPIATDAFGTGDQIDLVRPRLNRPQQMETFNPSAAGQGKKADPKTELLFERTSVLVLVGIQPLTEKKSMAQFGIFSIHNQSPK